MIQKRFPICKNAGLNPVSREEQVVRIPVVVIFLFLRVEDFLRIRQLFRRAENIQRILKSQKMKKSSFQISSPTELLKIFRKKTIDKNRRV